MIEVVVHVEPIGAAHLGGADREAGVARIGDPREQPDRARRAHDLFHARVRSAAHQGQGVALGRLAAQAFEVALAGALHRDARVVGAAQQPLAIPFQADMTLLDVMIRVGGVTEFADGDNATLVRLSEGEMREYRVRIDSLVRDGDISANIAMLPGDVLIIPESFF